ncbi:PDZ domain-containing protein [Streptomyces apocyni]|uniref:PDZ domain-containing protein n=1 Tax=Streptomyces apocyni TaxID=2654677 RepID=UPI001E437A43|nr:PDZ domain-containing protein [Streptomyces apocyni]
MDETAWTAETVEMAGTALRPKSMPGSASMSGTESGAESETQSGTDAGVGAGAGSGRRQRAAHRRRRRPLTAVLGVVAVLVLVLTGVGLGTVGATVISMGKLADLKERPGERPPGGAPDTPAKPDGTPRPSGPEPQGGQSATAPDAVPDRPAARATLGIEAIDAEQGAGALLVGVHIPGPGYSAGLVRGDVLLAIGGHPVRTAAELAAEVAAARPGKAVAVTVRHEDGARESLSVRPGVVT